MGVISKQVSPNMTHSMLSPFYKGHIRGLYPSSVNEELMIAIAHKIIDDFPEIKTVSCARDSRHSSPSLQQVFMDTLLNAGVHVCDLGIAPSELVYFSSFDPTIDAAFMITASHNPRDYNGLKALRHAGLPFQEGDLFPNSSTRINKATKRGRSLEIDFSQQYLKRMKVITQDIALPKLKILANACHGTAFSLANALFQHFELEVDWIQHEANGDFPACGPDPSSPQYQDIMRATMKDGQYDLAIAWDGDADRCLFYDHRGKLVSQASIMGLIAEDLLIDNPGSAIIYEHKISWALHLNLDQYDWTGIKCKTGHINMKKAMQNNKAIYGGEISGHHYFASMHYCDNGNLPWIYILALLHEKQKSLAELAENFAQHAPSLPEINLKVKNSATSLQLIADHFVSLSLKHDDFDGLTCEFDSWRFNLRQSHTEPCLRLNIESKPSETHLLDHRNKILSILEDQVISFSPNDLKD